MLTGSCMNNRELVVRVDGTGPDSGRASVFVYRLGSQIEIVATEEHNGDASVLLSEASARVLLRSLMAVLGDA